MTDREKIDALIKKYGLVCATHRGHVGVAVCIGSPTPEERELIRANKMAVRARIRELQAEKRAAEEAARREKVRRIRDGEELIRLRWSEGDILQAWAVEDYDAARLLEEIGVARYVIGWGHKVRQDVVDALGTEFTYPQAAEYVRPMLEAREAKKKAREAERAAKFDEARRTGKAVLLRKWLEPCCDPREECSMDLVSEYALPDGSTKNERHHTW